MSIQAKGRKSGFTIMELMVAMLATAIFSLAVGAMLVYAWMGWRHNTDSVQMQRDASLAMRVIAKEIRRTPFVGITTGTSLVCSNAVGLISITKNGGDLDMQVNADTPLTLVRDVVTSFDTKANANGSVEVALGLNTGADDSSSKMVVFSRN